MFARKENTNMDARDTIWIDALDFEQKGGWKEDTQYVHLMGSGYLIAADEPGVPVEDATVKFNVSESGIYRIWVRDRNWLRSYSPGQFTVLVDGKETNNILGKMPSDKWLWEIAADVDLDAGEHTISLKDLSGYFARCASIVLTRDMDYVPSREIERMHRDRAIVKGISDKIEEGGDFDLVVVGGGPGGCPAAIAAARKGLKVLLIQNRSVLGGNGSSEVGITFDGASKAHINARESGIAEEIRRLRDRDPEYFGDWERAITSLVNAEANITVLYNNHVYAADTSGSSISGVYAINIRTLEKTHFTAKLFIDASGDAWLGYYAGAKFRFGREAMWQHDESIAPESADTLTMSGCIKSGNRPYFFESDTPVEYHAPEWVPQLPKTDAEFGRAINGNGASLMWWLEAPNVYDDMWDGEETRDALLMVILGYYDHIKNYWSKKELAQKYKLRFVSVYNGRRESRRLVGDYILTQNDATSAQVFEDAVSYSGWAIDLHHPEGIYSGSKGPLYAALKVPMPTIPYRCLYSANVENLFFAGRNISVTHVALGTVRVQNTIAALGQVVGTAAAMCIKLNEMPRGIYKRHIKELQQELIKDDMFIPGIKNEDKNDPCLTAKVTASSISNSEAYRASQGTLAESVPLDTALLTTANFNRNTHGDINEVWVWLCSSNDKPTKIKLGARIKGDVDTFFPDAEPCYSEAVVPPMHDGWMKVDIHVPVVPDKYRPSGKIELWIERAEGIAWKKITNLSFSNICGKRDDNGEWKKWSGETFALSVDAPIEKTANCSPENVINGVSRIRSADVYEWVSDPEESMPQWIELEFKEPAEINSVSIVFDTDMTNPSTCWTVKIPEVPSCVKDYSVQIFEKGKWANVANVNDNFMRKRIHKFESALVEKIRVNVFSAWGDKSARIMEIRASMDI